MDRYLAYYSNIYKKYSIIKIMINTRTHPPISSFIWDLKYRLKSFSGNPLENSIEDTWWRVARTIASVEKDKKYWQQEYYNAFTDFKLIPAGRVLAGAGTKRNVTLVNTFVMGRIPDNLEGIFHSLKESALTLRQGGGIGCDFSTMRPANSEIRGVESSSSGPIPFMDVWNEMCDAIISGGVRRGAMIAMLRCDHPDIEKFIIVKQKPGRLCKFNLSVLVTDKFMKAVKMDDKWDLVFNERIYKTISAKSLWDKIMMTSYQYSEPGVIFIDVINRLNNLHYCEYIIGTNSCGEQVLPPYGSCPLACINLSRLVDNPFQRNAKINLKYLTSLTSLGIRMLDNILDITKYPLSVQKQEAQSKRRVGLGITGLADALVMCGMHYGSDKALRWTEELMSIFQEISYSSSAELSKQRGCFPLYDKKFLEGKQAQNLSLNTRKKIRKYKIRNAVLNSIPPTGTTSLYAGNISSGIEPIYSLTVTRKILLPDGTNKEIKLDDFAFELFKIKEHTRKAPDHFITSAHLTTTEHLKMQSIVQKYVDSSISKTINCPKDISFEAFKNVYFQAYKSGCKGCTTFRSNDVRGYVMKTR